MGKATTIESLLNEVIIEGTKIQPLKGPLCSPRFKGYTQDDVSIAKSTVRLHNIEEDRTKD